MKIKHIIPAFAALAMLAACSEDSWNDKLDGFTVPPVYGNVETVKYTLTSADYSTIASLAANKAIAEAEGPEAVEALAAIASNQCFADQDQARLYIPAFLASTSTNLYVLNDGSQVDIVYNLASEVPEIVRDINSGVNTYAVDQNDYKKAWGSDEDFIDAFAPMTPANSYINGFLKSEFPDAESGEYTVVTYAQADVNPIFGSVSGGGETSSWEPTAALKDLALGDNIKVQGYIAALDTRGFVLADNAGAILCYQSSGFNVDEYNIGDQVTIQGEVTSYGAGFQLDLTAATWTVDGTASFSYPTPVEYDGAAMDAAVTRTENALAQYCTLVGTLSISGNYYNINVEGAETAVGSGYMVPDFIKAQLEDGGTYRFYGYFTAVTGSNKYFNLVITSVDAPGAKARRHIRYAPVNTVTTTNVTAVYGFDGAKWSVPANTLVLQASDYTTLGQTYSNLSGTGPETLLPRFLAMQYPFAQSGDIKTVVYNYYNGSTNAYRAAQFEFDGSEWTMNRGAIADKFAKNNGVWEYNPSVVITLPEARNTPPAYTYYMACVDWVFNNISKPEYGSTELSDAAFIDYRGNAEFYSGASAYYGNVDIRAAAAKNNAPEGYTGYDGLTDDEIVLLLKKRFSTQTLPGALSALHPDAAPAEGMEVTYTVNFTAYTGSRLQETIVYDVVGKGEFKYKSSTWAEGQDADW